MIVGMNHVAMSVSDMERALGFYRDLLGMEVMVRRPFGYEGSYEYEKHRVMMNLKGAQGTVVLLRRGEMSIELFQFDDPKPRPAEPNRPVCDHGITHFCLQVTDIHSEYERFKAAGVIFHCPPLDFPGKALATYGRDPDGNVFELIELTRSAETRASSTSTN